MPHLRYEKNLWRKGLRCVLGVDEAGVGPLAGPVVAASVKLAPGFRPDSQLLRKVNDCKLVAAPLREKIYAALISNPRIRYVVAKVTPHTIDRINIFHASRRAMLRCVQKLCGNTPGANVHLLVDGALPLHGTGYPQTPIVKGDRKAYSIAAASIIAKVTRDRLMQRLHKKYPRYNFAQHKGYGTKAHYSALTQYGPSPIHRKSFL